MFNFITTIQIKFVKILLVANDIKENLQLQNSTFHLYVVQFTELYYSVKAMTHSSPLHLWRLDDKLNQSALAINTKGTVILKCLGS